MYIMTSYDLNPNKITDDFLAGPSFGAPTPKTIVNNGLESRSLNQFDKTFKTSLQTIKSEPALFGGGKGRSKRSKTIKKKSKKVLAKKQMKKKTLKKNKSVKKIMKSKNKYSRSCKKAKRSLSRRRLVKIGGKEPLTGVGYTMDTNNTDSLNGALATPFNITNYRY